MFSYILNWECVNIYFDIVFFPTCYIQIFKQENLYIGTGNHLEHPLENTFLSTLKAMFGNNKKKPHLEHPKTLQQIYSLHDLLPKQWN